MSTLEFVNIHGNPVSTAPVKQAKRPKREKPESWHGGWRVVGIPPGALEAAREEFIAKQRESKAPRRSHGHTARSRQGAAVTCEEKATVYRGGGRRWFTRTAAIRAEAKALHKARYARDCYCSEAEPGPYGAPGETCHLHQPEFYQRFVRRVSRLLDAAMKGKQP